MDIVRRIVAGFGRSLISGGVLVLLFVIYELYGTSLQELWAQNDLIKRFNQTTSTTQKLPEAAVKLIDPPPPGSALATMRIEKLGLFKAVVEGVDTNDLKKGPGHYAGTPLPGEAGNVAIAGHRTTYGAPFYRINELAPGDSIVVITKQGSFTYRVRDQKVVGPDDNYVLNPTKDNILTLTTCHPRFSAAQRLIVTAVLQGDPTGVRDLSAYYSEGPAIVGEEGAGTRTPGRGTTPLGGATSTSAPAPRAGLASGDDSRQGGVSGHSVPRGPAIQWGIISALVALGTFIASRRWRKWPAYALGTPVFLVVLYVFFENVASLLPANV